MRLLLTITALLLSSACYSQSSLTGKWKPVFFSLDTFSRGDIKADTLFINDAIKENFKNDKDPETSEKMMRFLMEAIFKKMKETQEEYFNDGKYAETNTRTGRTTEGTYIFNKMENKLERTQTHSNKMENFIVSWKNGQLVLTGELGSGNGKKGKLEIVYEKL